MWFCCSACVTSCTSRFVSSFSQLDLPGPVEGVWARRRSGGGWLAFEARAPPFAVVFVFGVGVGIVGPLKASASESSSSFGAQLRCCICFQCREVARADRRLPNVELSCSLTGSQMCSSFSNDSEPANNTNTCYCAAVYTVQCTLYCTCTV